jgi:hypothetical protein
MRYQASLEEKLEETKIIESGSLDMNKMWNNVKKVITAAGEEVMGTTTMQKRNVELFDEECRKKIAKKNETRRRKLQKETQGSYEKYKELQKDVKKVCKKKKKEHLQKQFEETEQLNRENERIKFYKAMDIIRKGYHPRQEACRDKNGKVLCNKEEIMNRWVEHFKDALNKECPSCNDQEKLDLELNIEGSDEDENSERPTYEEIEESTKKLKNGRAPGEDNIIPEMIKYGGKQLAKKLHELICVIWKEEKMTEDWETSIICPIFKKSYKLDCNNYRGITLLDIAYKVFSNVLNERLNKITENLLGEYQCGFRKIEVPLIK